MIPDSIYACVCTVRRYRERKGGPRQREREGEEDPIERRESMKEKRVEGKRSVRS